MNSETNILMVCLGNICRSPMAEGILRYKVQAEKLAVDVDSCGFESYHIGEPPDDRAIATAKRHGVDLSDLRARKFRVEDFDRFDRIYVMDSRNYRDVLSKARNAADREKVEMIMNLIHPGENRTVPDPYYGDMQGFEVTYRLLDQATDRIMEEIRRK